MPLTQKDIYIYCQLFKLAHLQQNVRILSLPMNIRFADAHNQFPQHSIQTGKPNIESPLPEVRGRKKRCQAPRGCQQSKGSEHRACEPVPPPICLDADSVGSCEVFLTSNFPKDPGGSNTPHFQYQIQRDKREGVYHSAQRIHLQNQLYYQQRQSGQENMAQYNFNRQQAVPPINRGMQNLNIQGTSRTPQSIYSTNVQRVSITGQPAIQQRVGAAPITQQVSQQQQASRFTPSSYMQMQDRQQQQPQRQPPIAQPTVIIRQNATISPPPPPTSSQNNNPPKSVTTLLNKDLQKKAYQSYKKLVKVQPESLFDVKVGFFYCTQTQMESFYLNEVDKMRKRLRNFGISFVSCTHERVKDYPPKLLVVADDIFQMQDSDLQKFARTSIPNFYRNPIPLANQQDQRNRGRPVYASTLGGASISTVQRDVPFTDHIIQTNIFTCMEHGEAQDASIHAYLSKCSHDIITFRMCEKLVDLWFSQKPEWHIERGLKLQADGSACQQNSKAITFVQWQQLNPQHRKGFTKEAKASSFCISSIKSGMLTAHQQSSGMQSNPRAYAQEHHFFLINPTQQQSELKNYYRGKDLKIGKYDYPHFNPKAPLGTSLFPIAYERKYAEENYDYFVQKHAKDLENLNKQKTQEEKHPKVIEEPRPGANHLFCAICKEQFKDYISHIFCMNHRNNVRTGLNHTIYQEIDKALVDINRESKIKENEFLDSMMQKRLKQKQIDFNNLLISNLRDVNNPEERMRANEKSSENQAVGVSTKSSSNSSENDKITLKNPFPVGNPQLQLPEKSLIIDLDGDEAEINQTAMPQNPEEEEDVGDDQTGHIIGAKRQHSPKERLQGSSSPENVKHDPTHKRDVKALEKQHKHDKHAAHVAAGETRQTRSKRSN